MQYFETKKELTPSVIVNPKYIQMVIYSLQLPDLLKDDVIQVSTQCQVTNDMGYNLMVCKYLRLSSGKDTRNITAPCGTNVLPLIHHLPIHIARQYKLTKDMIAPKLELICYSAGFDGQLNGKVKVDQGYGHLDCVLIRNT